MILTGCQIREARESLGWPPLQLASSALVTLDEVRLAEDQVGVHALGGLQLGAIRQALEAAGVLFIAEDGEGSRVRLPKVAPAGRPERGWAGAGAVMADRDGELDQIRRSVALLAEAVDEALGALQQHSHEGERGAVEARSRLALERVRGMLDAVRSTLGVRLRKAEP